MDLDLESILLTVGVVLLTMAVVNRVSPLRDLVNPPR